jgi:hypothetical protein
MVALINCTYPDANPLWAEHEFNLASTLEGEQG